MLANAQHLGIQIGQPRKAIFSKCKCIRSCESANSWSNIVLACALMFRSTVSVNSASEILYDGKFTSVDLIWIEWIHILRVNLSSLTTQKSNLIPDFNIRSAVHGSKFRFERPSFSLTISTGLTDCFD